MHRLDESFVIEHAKLHPRIRPYFRVRMIHEPMRNLLLA